MSPTKRRLIITLVTLLLVSLVPAAVMAAGGAFTDDDDSIFEPHIEWMATTGITAGCNPPANDHYCPDDNVTRGQMAAFMRRFAQYLDAEDGTPAVADNANALGGSHADYYRTIAAGTTCRGNGCPDIGAIANVEVLEMDITAPRGGYLHVTGELTSYLAAISNDFQGMWITLNGDVTDWDGCEGSFIGVPLGNSVVDGTGKLAWFDGNIAYNGSAATSVVAVPAGTHTLRLCGFGSEALDPYSANLSAFWTAEGSATHLTSAAVEDLPQGLLDKLEAAVND